ncbi:MAG: methyltransferase regulatory domain-containing protein, partial [Candidatus Competibacterales bacterium]
PHGAAFFCYNAMPGWGVQLPLQWLMSRYAQRHQESPEAMGLAFGEMEKLMDLQASYWSANPEVQSRMAALKELDPHFFAHEYACEHVTPFYHAEFAAEMAQRRLRYVGSGLRISNYPHLLLNQQQCAHLDSQPEALRETLKDFFLNQLVRRDVYSRGGVVLPPVKVTERLNQLRFVLGVPKDHVRFDVQAPLYEGRVSLNGELVAPVVDALAELGPVTPRALVERTGLNLGKVHNALMGLWVTHQVQVAPATDADAVTTSMLNFVLAMGGLTGKPTDQLVSPVCRAGVDLPWPEQLMAVQYNLQGKEKMGEVVAMLLKQFGKPLTEGGDPAAEQAALAAKLENFEGHWAPLLRQWGIIVAD